MADLLGQWERGTRPESDLIQGAASGVEMFQVVRHPEEKSEMGSNK
jgi:hypothetical protein